MSILTLPTPALPRGKFGGFTRLIKTALSAIEIFVEAQQMANEARRFPYGRL